MAVATLILLAPLCRIAAQTVEVFPAIGAGSQAFVSTQVVLAGCMDALFEKGYIAADSRPVMLSAEEWANSALGIKAAEDGFADYVLSFYSIWAASTAVVGKIYPVSLRYRIVKVTSVKVLFEGSIDTPADTLETFRKYDAILRALGTSVAQGFINTLEHRGPALGSASGFNRLGGYL